MSGPQRIKGGKESGSHRIAKPPTPGPTPPVKSARDPSSQDPLHVQAEAWLRRLISEKKYQDGALLPDEISLADQLQVSRATLRIAILRLVADGLIERQRGVGTKVLRRPISHRLGAWSSFSKEMEDQGIAIRLLMVALERVVVDERTAAALEVDSETTLLRLTRVRGDGSAPVVRMQSWFPPDVPLSAEDDLRRPLYDLLRPRGFIPVLSRESITAVAADMSLAMDLAVEIGTPLLCRRRLVLNAKGQPLELAINHYRCDRFALDLELNQENQ